MSDKTQPETEVLLNRVPFDADATEAGKGRIEGDERSRG
jgi:hypothetical protein